ncbi:MAG: hypothetical protein HN366_29570, partial [Deltaproteobacteria bacterium]|nr:hypothetical protein [Deltaproteobacteria bacterium]
NIGNNLPQNWFVGCPGGSPGKAYSLPCEHDILAVQDSQQTFSIVFDSGEDKLYILSPIAEKFTYEISSLDGKIVQYGIISDSDQSIKLTKIQNSVYAIRIVSSTRSMTKLFVKY